MQKVEFCGTMGETVKIYGNTPEREESRKNREKGDSMVTNQELAHFFKEYRNALFVINLSDDAILYCNEIGESLYGITGQTKDLYHILPYEQQISKEKVDEVLRTEDFVIFYDVTTRTVEGKDQLADIQIDFFHADHSSLLVEIRPKKDIRLEMALHQIHHATRAEGILLMDDNLTLLQWNSLAKQLFPAENTPLPPGLTDGFLPEVQKELLEEIKENLKKYPVYYTKVQLNTQEGNKEWFSLELQRRTLDSSGMDKVMAYLVNIDNQVELEETNEEMQAELTTINRYFKVLQEISEDCLFRVDIRKKELYRSSNNISRYGLPQIVKNFPQGIYENNLVYPADIPLYDMFAVQALHGVGGVTELRMKESGKDSFEYRKISWSPVENEDGTVGEVFGKLENIQNIHELKVELQNINQYFDALQKLSDDLIFRVDILSQTLIRHSDKAELWGLSDQVKNFPQAVYESGEIHPDDLGIYQEFVGEMLKGQGGTTELRMKNGIAGKYGYRRLIWTPVVNEEGEIVEVFGKLIDIQGVRELEIKANYDATTNTLNKSAMADITGTVLEKSTEEDCHALLFLDLDDFKFVNDHLGHSFGDVLLRTLGERLHESNRSGDLVGRVGGDEFVIFLKNIPNVEMLEGKGQRILATLSKDVVEGDLRHAIQGSIGVAVYPQHGTTYEELYRRADLALYRSKHEGKNLVTLYTPDMES